MDLAVAQELGVLQARDQAKTRSCSPNSGGSESRPGCRRRREVLLAQLHHGVGPLAGARVAQAHRLHRAEAQRVAPAPRQLLDGQAALEVAQSPRTSRGVPSAPAQRVVESARTLPASSGSSGSRRRPCRSARRANAMDVSMESASTMGRWRRRSTGARRRSAAGYRSARASAVSGPVARISGRSVGRPSPRGARC